MLYYKNVGCDSNNAKESIIKLWMLDILIIIDRNKTQGNKFLDIEVGEIAITY